MRIYTVTGLVDAAGGDLYVSAVFPGRHTPEDRRKTTAMEGYGDLERFTGFFEADSAAEAEQIAADIVAHWNDADVTDWSQRKGPYIQDVDTGGRT